MGERGGGMAYHARFVSEGQLDQEDPLVVEHESLCRIFDVGLTIDQLHVSRLLSFELICRGLQRIAARFKDKFLGKPSVDNGGGKKGKAGPNRAYVSPEADLHLYLGSSSMRGRVMMGPLMGKWLAEKKLTEVSLLCEDRKLAQERQYLAGGQEPPKDK